MDLMQISTLLVRCISKDELITKLASYVEESLTH